MYLLRLKEQGWKSDVSFSCTFDKAYNAAKQKMLTHQRGTICGIKSFLCYLTL